MINFRQEVKSAPARETRLKSNVVLQGNHPTVEGVRSDPGGVEGAVRVAESTCSEIALDHIKVVVDTKLAEPVVDQVLLLLIRHGGFVGTNLFRHLMDLGQLCAEGMIRLSVGGEHVDTAASGHDRRDRAVDRDRRQSCS